LSTVTPGTLFRDHPLGPLLVCVPSGSFFMGSEASDESPVRKVTFAHSFAIGVFPITFNDWDIFFRDGGTTYLPSDRPLYPDYGGASWGRGTRPVINVCWNDAQQYVNWLSTISGLEYRLPTEAEWEYAARAGTTGPFTYGRDLKNSGLANCKDCGSAWDGRETSEVGSFPPNAFGLHDVHGNVWEWVQDSMNEFEREGYNGGPIDGGAWEASAQAFRMMRGGSWKNPANVTTVSKRKWSTAGYRYNGGTIGFRVARHLSSKEMGIPFTSLTRPVSRQDLAQDRKALGQMQGGILSDHGRDFGALLLGRFGSAPKGRTYLKTLGQFVTTQTLQNEQARDFRVRGLADHSFMTVHLTSAGYTFLGFDISGFEDAFRDGMAKRRSALNDPDRASFETPYQADFHFCLLLASDNKASLESEIEEAIKLFANYSIDLVHSEQVYRKRNEDGAPIEHFGFVDGISNPIFLPKEQSEPKLSTNLWNSIAPISLAMVQDPLVTTGDAFGSYLVLRKIAQHREQFDEAVKTIAEVLSDHSSEEETVLTERAAAAIIGRFRDGTPLVLTNRPIGITTEDNNFDFNGDMDGSKCPYFSHIRKTNPRGQHGGMADRDHRICRRGMLFGKADSSTVEKHYGIMFLCYQASIQDQFEFIQNTWANDATFLFGRLPGPDPLIGTIRLPVEGEPYPPYPALDWDGYRWPLAWGDATNTFTQRIPPLTTLLGGEYMFTPSVAWLRSIAM
jgi:Dyp-type peroxidase family